MANNLFAMLQQAHSTAKGSDGNVYGVETAIVTNVKDPEKAGRVKVCFPRLPGKPESDWVRIAQPAAGPGRGFYWVPEVHDEVLVAFERGQQSKPFIIGALWNGKDKPMDGAYTDENTTRMIQSKSGHQIVLDDKSGAEKMVFADKSGKRTLTFDVKAKKYLIEAKEGDVEIHAEKKIVLQCEDLEIKTKKTGKVDIGSTFSLKVAEKASFKAGPQMNWKASEVNLNPPSIAVDALEWMADKAAKQEAEKKKAADEKKKEAQNKTAASPGGGNQTVPTRDGAQSGASGKPSPGSGAEKGGAPEKDRPQKGGGGGVEGTEFTKEIQHGKTASAGGATKPATKQNANALMSTDAGAASDGAAPGAAHDAGGAASNAAAADNADKVQPDIEKLDLAPNTKAAAYQLRKAHPEVVFTSGRRDKASQARAMASNVVSERGWIKATYRDNAVSRACQKWVDDHPEAKTQSELAAGLLETLNGLSDAAVGELSRHLTGAAFDVQPNGDEAVKKTIRGLPNLNKFLEKEGNKIRWHAQFDE